jgi:SOS-response transcriptional repressor LexA
MIVDMPSLREIVIQRLDELGVSAIQAAEQSGLKREFIYDIVEGKKQSVRSDKLPELARALKLDAAALARNAMKRLPESGSPDTVPVPPGRLPYGGVVAAGDWLTVDEFNQDLADQVVPESVPRHPGYPKLEQIAWRVRGDSMDQAGILDGMWLVGAPYLEYVDRIGELDNGAYVVVERTRYQGAERELTVKEVQFARRGMRLIPRSSNPRHREFFIDLDEKADPDTESVRILGVVLWAGRDLAPGR